MFEAVSLCNIFGGGTHLTVLGESPFSLLLGDPSEIWVDLLSVLLRLGLRSEPRWGPKRRPLGQAPQPLQPDPPS